jgi:hypothetical protein
VKESSSIGSADVTGNSTLAAAGLCHGVELLGAQPLGAGTLGRENCPRIPRPSSGGTVDSIQAGAFPIEGMFIAMPGNHGGRAGGIGTFDESNTAASNWGSSGCCQGALAGTLGGSDAVSNGATVLGQ